MRGSGFTMGKKITLIVLAIFIMSIFSFSAFGTTIEDEPIMEDAPIMEDTQTVEDEQIIERARVLEVELIEEEEDFEFFKERYNVKLEILSGEYKGMQIETIHGITGNIGFDIIVEPGNKVLVTVEDEDGEIKVNISEYVRDNYIKLVSGLFVALLIIVGGIKGIKTVITLALTIGLILKVLIPGLLAGYSPIILAILISIVITVVTILIVGGVNKKSYGAIIGVLVSVIIAGFVAYVAGTKARLTGLSSEEAVMLMYIPQGIKFNYSGLLFAGIIMGALGGVMDVGMSISSAIGEVKNANPLLTTKDLIKSGMNVGRDIMGTMSNTLILAYTGSAIPLMLLFSAYKEPYSRIINLDVIATEIIRAFAGSIGLILCVPLTAVISGILISKDNPKEKGLEQEEIV